MNQLTFSIATLFISFSTLAGIILHATHLDKATVAIVSGSVGAHYDTVSKQINSGDAHTHVERHGFSRIAASYQSTSPGIPPRAEDKKHLMQRYIPKGHYAFDNYNLPLI
jgi:hypothetical protein